MTQARWRALAVALVLPLCCPLAAHACDDLADPRALPSAAAGHWSLVTQNLWRLRDDVDDGGFDEPLAAALVQARVRALARHVRDQLALPHVLAVQEVENRALLQALADAIAAISPARYRVHLLEGADPSGMDVGVLVRAPLAVKRVSQVFRDARYRDASLFSRPPLQVQLAPPVDITLLVVHLRSARGLDDARRGNWVRGKRAAQARALRDWMRQQTSPVVLVGDLNSAPGEGVFGEPLAVLDDAWPLSAWRWLEPAERYSFRHQCLPQAIDHVLLPAELASQVHRVAVSRGNAGRYDALYGSSGMSPVSDHDALAVYFRLPSLEARDVSGEGK